MKRCLPFRRGKLLREANAKSQKLFPLINEVRKQYP